MIDLVLCPARAMLGAGTIVLYTTFILGAERVRIQTSPVIGKPHWNGSLFHSGPEKEVMICEKAEINLSEKFAKSRNHCTSSSSLESFVTLLLGLLEP